MTAEESYERLAVITTNLTDVKFAEIFNTRFY